MRNLAMAFLLASLAACGGGGGDDDGVDPPDASAADVVEVSCAGATIAQTIATSGLSSFDPTDSTIAVGGIVQFVMPASHNAVDSGGAFNVDTGETLCFQFNVAETYNFTCTIHGFNGTLTVN